MKSSFFLLAVAILLRPSGCNESLNKGLQEEKSYTRAAMEKYREDPKYFKGSNPDVLSNWSRMDYLATAVAKQNASGEWATPANKLGFADMQVQTDTDGKPYCVLHRDEMIVVFRLIASPAECSTQTLSTIKTSQIASGDLDFSRPDYWIFVLRTLVK